MIITFKSLIIKFFIIMFSHLHQHTLNFMFSFLCFRVCVFVLLCFHVLKLQNKNMMALTEHCTKKVFSVFYDWNNKQKLHLSNNLKVSSIKGIIKHLEKNSNNKKTQTQTIQIILFYYSISIKTIQHLKLKEQVVFSLYFFPSSKGINNIKNIIVKSIYTTLFLLYNKTKKYKQNI